MMNLVPTMVGVVLFFGLMVGLEFGRRTGLRRFAADPEGYRTGAGAIDGAMFALLGLLVAFTFSGAATRFEHRRDLIVSESNDIGTAWLRLDVLPPESQPALRDAFRRYVDSRVAYYRLMPDLGAAQAEAVRTQQLQQDLWNQAVAAVKLGGTPQQATLVLPAINEMIDIVSTRAMASLNHPPMIIFALLVALSLVCAFLAGHGMAVGKSRSLTHMVGFSLVLAATVFVIIDLEYPRLGLIRVDAADDFMVQVRASMN